MNVCCSQGRHILFPLFARVPINATDSGLGEVFRRPQWIPKCLLNDYVGMKSVRIEILYRPEAVEYKKIMDLFISGHSFEWMVSIKSWFKCWKPSRKSAWNLRNDCKTSTTGASFHRVRETELWQPIQMPSRGYSIFRREKNEVFANLRTRTGLNRITFYFESVGRVCPVYY